MAEGTVIRDVWSIDTSDAREGIRKLANEVDHAKTKTKGITDFMKDDFTKSFLTAQAAATVLTNAIQGLGRGIVDASKVYLENAEISARMGVVLRNAGYDSDNLRAHFERQALALAKVTGKSDDYIGNLQTLILGMITSCKKYVLLHHLLLLCIFITVLRP